MLIFCRYFRLIGKDRCLVILEDSVHLRVFFDFTRNIAKSIESNSSKKEFKVEKVGKDVFFAVDESRRLFSLLSRTSVSLQTSVMTRLMNSHFEGPIANLSLRL
jgi:hypothetical protein